MDLRDKIIIKDKVIDMLYRELGKAEAELFCSQCKVKVYNNEIQKQKKKLDKMLEGEIRV